MDLIELLPIILIALYYIFRPGKKKDHHEHPEDGHQEHDPMEPQRQHRTLDDILREALEGRTRQEQGPEPVPEEFEPEPEPEVEAEVPNRYKDYTGVWEESAKDKRRRTDELKRLEVKELADSADSIDFDLEQAVINDAILNKPWS